jgi:hypothetical protein
MDTTPGPSVAKHSPQGNVRTGRGRMARRAAVATLSSVIALCGATSAVSLVVWQRDLAEVRRIVGTRIDENAPQEEIILAAREFMRDEVGYGRHDAYFLLPIFRFMRPTARQVIRDGGDCAYRTRAFIVILRQYGIKASKLALYDDAGRSVHAVAEVHTDDGIEYHDLLFNIFHQDAQGRALSLEQLADRDVLRGSVERAIAEGNARAKIYPIDEYDFESPRSINWTKSPALALTYRVIAAAIGEERASRIPRPHISEEPASMVAILCLGTGSACLIVIWGIERKGARSRAPEKSAHAGRDWGKAEGTMAIGVPAEEPKGRAIQPLLEAWVESIPQAVANEVESEDEERQEQPGEDCEVRRVQ